MGAEKKWSEMTDEEREELEPIEQVDAYLREIEEGG